MNKEFKKSKEVLLLEKKIIKMKLELDDTEYQLKLKIQAEFDKYFKLVSGRTIIKHNKMKYVYLGLYRTDYDWWDWIMARKIITNGSLSVIEYRITGDWEKTGEEYTPVKSKECTKKA